MTAHFYFLLFVMCGGALGAGARYGLSHLVGTHGILIANLIGCFLIGVFVSFVALKTNIHQGMSLFLTVGLLGGFTTFSTFSLETMALIDTQRYIYAVFYITTSVGGGLLAFVLGRGLIKTIL